MASEKKEKQDSLPMTFFKAVGITLLAVGLSLVLFQPFSFWPHPARKQRFLMPRRITVCSPITC